MIDTQKSDGNGWNIIFYLFLNAILFAIVGGVTGYYMDKRKLL